MRLAVGGICLGALCPAAMCAGAPTAFAAESAENASESAETEQAAPAETALESPEKAQAKRQRNYPLRPTIWGRAIVRQGFHFHASLGAGLGPHIVGLYHAMEIGGSYRGYSISLLHTFLQNRGVFGTTWGGPDEIGGFMLQLAGPLYFDDLVWKFASGVGGTADQGGGQFRTNPGFGVHYGVDLHYPVFRRFGPTLSLDAMNVFTQGQAWFGMGLALGISVF